MEFLGIETRRVEFLHGHSIGHELMSFCFFLVCIIANVLQSQDQGGVGYLSAFFFSFLLLHIHIATWKKKVNNFHTYLGDGKNTGMGINWYGMGNYGSVFFCVFFFFFILHKSLFFLEEKCYEGN